MSVIEKMSVMGIRSFGTEDYNKQIIEFFTPLTLILGPNGSGKTTIIECLRYVTTGDTPPNSDRGGSFVHDPKIAQETEVKGQVKIQLTDVMKKKVVASRSLLATQKQKKVQLKTLEGSITRIGTSGEKIHLSSKCAEIDLEMISSLGVSKAILNNVIFCHQEESNWPLSEGKALKQKFDDIFAATRYIKALEEIRKTRVQKMNDINVYKADVAYLKMNRKKAEEISEELEKTEVRFSACQDTVSKIETKLKPVVEELDDISVKMNEIGGLQATLESKKAVSLKLDKNYASLRDSIENIFHGTREDLELERDNFKSSVSQKKKQLEKLKSQCFSKELNYKEILRKKSGHLEELGKLKTENMQHKERVVKRDMILSEKSKLLSLGEITIENGESLRTSQIENILRNWKQQNNMTHQKLADMKEKYECKENEVQSQIDKVRDMKSQLDQKLRSCTDQITKNKSSISNIKEEINFVDGLATKQEELEMDIKETEDEVGLIERSFDVEAIKSKINEWQREKAAMTVEISNLNSEMNKLQNESKTRTEIDLIMKDKGSKQYAIDKMRDTHKETIIHLLGEIPKENVQDAVKSLINTLSHSMQSINKDMDKKKSQFSALQTTKKLQREELKKLQETAAKHRNKIVQACGSQDFDEGLDVLEKTVKELQDEKGALTGSLYIYNKYIEKLGAQHPCCPLCTRNFQRDEEAKSLITDLQRKLQMVPSQLDKKEKAIAEHQQRLNSMLQLRPLKETLEMLDAKEIPELKSKIKDASEKIQILTGEISDLEEILDNKDCDLKTASGVLPDLTILDQNLKELERLDRRLSLLKRQLGGDDISRNIKEVSDDLTSLQTKVESIKQHIENNQQHITSHCEQVLMLKGRINDLKAQKLKIASGLQRKNSLKEQMNNLIKENSEVVVITKAAKEELVVLEKQLCDLINKKDHLIKKKEADLDKIRMQINDQEKEIEKINVLSDDINRYIKDGKEKILADHEDILCNLEAEIHQISDDIATLEGKCNNINKEIINHELKCREYEDNIKLMDFQEEIASLSEESKKLKDKIGGYNIRSLRETRRLLLEEQKVLNKELAETEGRQGELKIQIRKLKDSLKDPMFKDADKKHREKAIQLRTTELVCEDLSKYYVALDRAIMGYHKMKMEEINKIIRDLWMKTYSGNDIDCIEIRSNEDDSEAGLEKAKRTYNYKVVMIKGDTAIDMRGRCSAGQKVLASLIIRLALAETFCLNCGILALDEPTTNLDRDNISSLARGLIEIVQCRSEQRNFQLIIITHDEDFIELLGRSETVDYFYRVSKDNNGLSRLSKCYISEMS